MNGKKDFIVLTMDDAQYLSELRSTKRQHENVMDMSIVCGAKWSDGKEMWAGKDCFVCSCEWVKGGRKRRGGGRRAGEWLCLLLVWRYKGTFSPSFVE